MQQSDMVIAIVEGTLGITHIQPQHLLREELGADSLDIHNILTTMEAQFHLEFSSNLEELTTVADLQHLSAQIEPHPSA